MFKGKIFGIGYPKTGTISLNYALILLGYNSIHEPHDFEELVYQKIYRFPQKCRCNQKNIDGSINNPVHWDAITNFGEYIYPFLDKEYPNSKFILTTRNTNTWWDSWQNLYNPNHIHKKPDWWKNKIHNLFYDELNYTEYIVKTKYEQHQNQIKSYFKNRQNTLLILPIELSDKNKWTLLCKFLDCTVIKQPFPHHNKGVY